MTARVTNARRNHRQLPRSAGHAHSGARRRGRGSTNADELRLVTVSLWPTAHVFERGHRIRVQVSCGAFPFYGRNPGTGERRADAVTLLTADQEVLHGAGQPSAVILPVRQKV